MVKGHIRFGLPYTSSNVRNYVKKTLGIFFVTFFSIFIFLNNPFIDSVSAQEQTYSHKAIINNPPAKFQLLFPGYLSQHYSKWHKALDLATGLGMPIKPIASGKVISAGYDFFGYGLKVEIDHGNGYKSLYAHLGKIYVKEGQDIDANHFIGEVGMTGRTTGPHTHLEVQKNSTYVDPEQILPEIREYAMEEDFRPVGGRNAYHPEEDPVHNKLSDNKQDHSEKLQFSLLSQSNDEESELSPQLEMILKPLK